MKKILIYSSMVIPLIMTGCTTKELTRAEINTLHQPYHLTEDELKKIAEAGCKAKAFGVHAAIRDENSKNNVSYGLQGYQETIMSVKFIGNIEKSYTSNPFRSNEFLTDTAGTLAKTALNTLSGKTTFPIYQGKCEATKITRHSHQTYLGRSNDASDGMEKRTYNFVINPQVCVDMKKNPTKYLRKTIGQGECFSLDMQPDKFLQSYTESIKNQFEVTQ